MSVTNKIINAASNEMDGAIEMLVDKNNCTIVEATKLVKAAFQKINEQSTQILNARTLYEQVLDDQPKN